MDQCAKHSLRRPLQRCTCILPFFNKRDQCLLTAAVEVCPADTQNQTVGFQLRRPDILATSGECILARGLILALKCAVLVTLTCLSRQARDTIPPLPQVTTTAHTACTPNCRNCKHEANTAIFIYQQHHHNRSIRQLGRGKYQCRCLWRNTVRVCSTSAGLNDLHIQLSAIFLKLHCSPWFAF